MLGYTSGKTTGPVRREPDGWIAFAGVMVLITGVFNGFEGLVGLFHTSSYASHYAVGSVTLWAIVWLAFGVLQVAAGLALLAGEAWARWFVIITVGVNLLGQILAISQYPWWSLVIAGYDLAILWAVTAHWRRWATR